MRIPSCLCPKSMFAREPPVKLSREEFEKRFSSRFADPVFKPLQLELGAIVDAGGTWTGDHDRKRAPAWCQQNMSRKRSNFPKVPLIRLASIRRFSRSAITRQLPDQALDDTAQGEARGDIAEPMRKQHNAGQD